MPLTPSLLVTLVTFLIMVCHQTPGVLCDSDYTLYSIVELDVATHTNDFAYGVHKQGHSWSQETLGVVIGDPPALLAPVR